MFQVLTADYSMDVISDYMADYSWPNPPNNSTGFSAAGFDVATERVHGVDVTSTSMNVLTSSLTTIFLPLVYIIIFIVGLPANAMAIWVFLFRTKRKHPASILMVNLALADLLFIIWLPLKIAYHFNGNNWIFGESLCKALVGFFYGNMYCSTIFIACISVHRYWIVVHPLSQKPNSRMILVISVFVWLVVWLITTPLYLYEQTVNEISSNITTCHDITRPSQIRFPVEYFLTMGMVGYVIPCVVCTVAYFLMFCSLRMSITRESSKKKKKKAINLMITVLVIFLVCFTPSNIMLMVHYSLLDKGIRNHFYSFYIIALCLGSLNSCLDPFVYYFVSGDFRDHVRNTLMCRSERTAKRIKVSYRPVKSSTETSSPTSQTSSIDF